MQRINIWRYATLFLAGLVGGLTYVLISYWPTSEPDSPPLTESNSDVIPELSEILARIDNKTPESSPEPDRLESYVTEGDRYLIGGNSSLALKHYREVEQGANTSPLLLRKAYCYENLGDFDSAAAILRGAIGRPANENHLLIALTGLSRVLLRQEKFDEAIALLGEQQLRIDRSNLISNASRSQLLFLFGKALELKAMSLSPATPNREKSFSPTAHAEDLSDFRTLASPNYTLESDRYLSMIDEAVEETPPNSNRPGIKILQKPSAALQTITASFSLELEPVPLILYETMQLAGLELRISERAQKAIEDRLRPVEITSIPLATFLDELLLPFGLIWQQTDSVIQVFDYQELENGAPKDRIYLAASSRAYRMFEIEYSDDHYRDYASLARAGNAIRIGDDEKAFDLFQQLGQTAPLGEIKACSFFNQAKLALKRQQLEQAIDLFYKASDQTRNPTIEASCYCLLCYCHLATSQIPEAIKTGKRGVASAVTMEQQQKSAIRLARSYLLALDPVAANSVLFQNRKVIVGKKEQAISAFLGAYARSTGVTDKERLEIARNRLLTSIGTMDADSFDNFADCYIASMAFESLGFRDHAIAMLQLGLSQKDARYWQRQAIFEMASLQMEAELTEEAIGNFRLLLETPDDWTLKSLIYLAELYAKTRQTEACLDVCKQLWQMKPDSAQRKRALQALGNSYQAQGEYHSAAICFAGLLPDGF